MKFFSHKKAPEKILSMYRVVLFLSLLIFLAPVNSFSNEDFVGVITKKTGRVDILKDGASSTIPLQNGASVSMGDILRTKSDGKAEIRFKDNTLVSLAPGTRMKIDDYSFSNDNRKSGLLRLFRGKVRAIVSKTRLKLGKLTNKGSSFNIQTPSAVAGVRGTDFFVSYKGGATSVLFREGSGFAHNPKKPNSMVELRAGHITHIRNDQAAPTPPREATDFEMDQSMGETSVPEEEATGDTATEDGQTGEAQQEEGAESGDPSSTDAEGAGETSTGEAEGETASADSEPTSAGETPVGGDPDTFIMENPEMILEPEPTVEFITKDMQAPTTNPDILLPYTETVPGTIGGLSGLVYGDAGKISGLASGTIGSNGWDLTLSGVWSSLATSLSIAAGGADLGNTGLWTENISGIAGGGAFSGTSQLKYITLSEIISGSGSVIGTYGGSSFSLTDTSLSYTTTALAFSSALTDSTGRLDGIVYGTQSLWSGGAVPISFIGIHPHLDEGSTDFSFRSHSISGGGAYFGFMEGAGGGTGGVVDAVISAIYVDGGGKAGFLSGSLTGSDLFGTDMVTMIGSVEPVQLASGISPTVLSSLTKDIVWGPNPSAITNVTGLTLGSTYSNGFRHKIPGQDWGIWTVTSGGQYSGTPSNNWEMMTTFNIPETIINTYAKGTNWSSGQILGKAIGFGADIVPATPNTWISVGDILGEYDAGLMDWHTNQVGVYLETNRFLNMAANEPAKLQAMNIPFAEVGIVNMTGTGTLDNGTATVNLNNVKFFDLSNGQAPYIWATGSLTGGVTGTYSCGASVCSGSIPLSSTSGGSITANMNMQKLDTLNQKWIGEISGTGTVTGITGTINMAGGAAGAASGGILSGTAAGYAN